MSCDNAADKIAMLLSTDWFEPHWPVIGLNSKPETRRCIQQGCREIVDRMIGAAEDYYLIAFSPERIQETRNAVLLLARKCSVDATSEKRLNELCRDKPERQRRESTAWLLSTMSDQLLDDDGLPLEVRMILAQAVVHCGADVNLKELNLDSASPWDRRIRALTPELPTVLSDWISVGLLAEAALDLILSNLNTEQRQLLFTRFKITAMKQTGLTEAELPDNW